MEILFILLLIYFYRQTQSNAPGRKLRPFSRNSVVKNYRFTSDEKERKGSQGERESFKILARLPYEQRILTNLYLPKKDGSTTEIDLVMINETGIYVVESKNYSGWIFGDDREKYWTQTMPNGKKQKFYNPVWQNESHIKALQELLRMKDIEVFRSYIVFSIRCTIKAMTISRSHVVVMNRDSLYKTALEEGRHRKTIFSAERVEELFQLLKPYTVVTEEERQRHIRQFSRKTEAASKVIAFPKNSNRGNVLELRDLDGTSRKVIPLEMKERQ